MHPWPPVYSGLTCGLGHCGKEQDGEGELHIGDGDVSVGLVEDLTRRVGLMSSVKARPTFIGLRVWPNISDLIALLIPCQKSLAIIFDIRWVT